MQCKERMNEDMGCVTLSASRFWCLGLQRVRPELFRNSSRPCLVVSVPHFTCIHRLYAKGVMVGFKRGLRNQYEHTSLLKIENVKEKSDVDFYLGKRVCFIYKAQNEVRGSKFRTIWGRVTRAHGSRSAAFHFICCLLCGC